jgi:hypothetical protein
VTTFSQAIDDLVAETRRPDMKAILGDYLLQTIRELHVDTKSGSVGRALKFPDNLVEDELTADAETGFTWAIAAPHRFQLFESAYYENRGLYSRNRSPSSAFAFSEEINGDVYHYRSGNYFCFSGYGGLDAIIKIAYYQYPARLTYYSAALRPAVWSDEAQGWTYLDSYDITDETRANAVALVTNWMLLRYPDLLKEGTRAKLYKRLNDPDRARMAFSAFESMKPLLISSETQDHSTTFSQ